MASLRDVEWLGAELGLTRPAALGAIHARANNVGACIAFPGLINSHDHLAFNLYPPTGSPPYRDFVAWSRDVQAQRELVNTVEAIPCATRMRFGLLKNLLWGVTAVADHGGRANALAEAVSVLPRYLPLHSPEFERWGRLKLLSGTGPVVMHMAEGITAESRNRARAFVKTNLLKRRIAGIHGVSLEADDFDHLDALVWCPASNLFLFGRTADIGAAAGRTAILFGTDATLSAPGTLWDHLREARGHLSESNILASLTTTAAGFWRVPASRLAQDFVVARRRKADRWDAFFSLTPADILMVVREGTTVLLDASLAVAVPAGMWPFVWGDICKYVRLPIDEMLAELNATAPHYDQAALTERYTGASAATGGWRAA